MNKLSFIIVQFFAVQYYALSVEVAPDFTYITNNNIKKHNIEIIISSIFSKEDACVDLKIPSKIDKKKIIGILLRTKETENKFDYINIDLMGKNNTLKASSKFIELGWCLPVKSLKKYTLRISYENDKTLYIDDFNQFTVNP